MKLSNGEVCTIPITLDSNYEKYKYPYFNNYVFLKLFLIFVGNYVGN